MLQGAQRVENAVWDYRLILPYAVMGVTMTLVAISQWPLFLSVATIAGSGALTYGAVKVGELYSVAKNVLTKVDTETLPKVDATLTDAQNILDGFEKIGNKAEHPLITIENAFEDRTKGILHGFAKLLHLESTTPSASSNAKNDSGLEKQTPGADVVKKRNKAS